MMDKSVTEIQSPSMDASVNITLSSDEMAAYITLAPAINGGAPLKADQIDRALKEAHVVFGIDEQLLNQLKSSPLYGRKLTIARGTAPQNGMDGSIRHHFSTIRGGHPKIRPDGSVDYRDLGLIENVHKDQVLSTLTLPTEGTPGMSVTGRKIRQKAGRPVDSPIGRNVKLSADQTQLLSTADGQVTLENNRVFVSETFEVKQNVDNSTGNIHFIGNVKVYGNVLDNFVVEAGGNIEVFGNVEGAELRAGGSITIRGGVVGRGSGSLTCRGDLTSTFFENCTVNCEGSVQVENSMNTQLRCSGDLELIGIRAKLIGGCCMVGGNIKTSSIGSPANLPTELILGAAPSLMARSDELKASISSENAQLGKLDQVVRLLTSLEAAGRMTADKRELLESARLSIRSLQEQLQKENEELNELKEKISSCGEGKVYCSGTVYRGVRITIGFLSMHIDWELSNVCFSNLDGKIVANPQ